MQTILVEFVISRILLMTRDFKYSNWSAVRFHGAVDQRAGIGTAHAPRYRPGIREVSTRTSRLVQRPGTRKVSEHIKEEIRMHR